MTINIDLEKLGLTVKSSIRIDDREYNFMNSFEVLNILECTECHNRLERISDDVAKLTKTQVGTEMAMWASFQPLYDLMLEKDDSFLN